MTEFRVWYRDRSFPEIKATHHDGYADVLLTAHGANCPREGALDSVIAEHNAVVEAARVFAVEAQEKAANVKQKILDELRRKRDVYEMPGVGHSAYSAGATDALEHMIDFLETV